MRAPQRLRPESDQQHRINSQRNAAPGKDRIGEERSWLAGDMTSEHHLRENLSTTCAIRGGHVDGHDERAFIPVTIPIDTAIFAIALARHFLILTTAHLSLNGE
jgi:hypothetical protein